MSNRIVNFYQFLKNRPVIRSFFILILLALIAIRHLEINFADFSRASTNLTILVNEAFPPDFSVITDRAAWSKPQCTFEADWACSPAIIGITQTLEIAFLSTIFGMVISLPLAAMAATNLSPPWLAQITRQILSALRVLPSLIWALIFVILVGLGPFAGVLAMTMYTVGYLGKLQYEALEGVSREPLEVARAMGLPRWQIARFFAIPEASNALISQMLFMFEYNVRHGSVIGLVGAGGIGYYLNYYLSPFQLYDRVLALIIVMYVVVVIIDQVSLRIRRNFIDSTDQIQRPRWREVIFTRKN